MWLDRGELEKLIGRATRDYDDEAPRMGDDTPPRGVRPLGQPPQPRKKRWLESLGDLFD
jgi:Zn-finger nucleic acid-binding protein